MRWEETDSFYTLGARLQYHRACGDGLTQFSAVVHYEVGAFSSEGHARCAASLDINQEYSRRPLHQRLLKSPNRFRHNVDIDPHKTTQDVLEFAFAEIACSPNASAMCSRQQPVLGSASYSTGRDLVICRKCMTENRGNPFCFSYLRVALAMHIQILQERGFLKIGNR